MEIERLVETAAELPGQTWAQRVDYAASLLFLHGYITTAQRRKVTLKLEKQFAEGIASGRIVERGK